MHVGELDIPLIISNIKAEVRDLPVLLGLSSPDRHGLNTNLDKEGFDDDDREREKRLTVNP